MVSILLVDDDPGQLELFRLLLRHLPYTLINAQSGDEALQALEQQVPDAIVLDLAMPRINGFAVLDHIKDNPRYKSTKVIILTAVPERMSRETAESVDKVISKAFLVPRLEQTLEELLAAPH